MDAVKQRKSCAMDRKLSVGIKLSAALFVFFLPLTIYAACSEDWIARVVSVQGQVDVREKNTETWQAAQLQHVYCQGDTIRVQANSRAALELHNDTILRLNQNSTLKLSGPKQDASWLDLLKGSLHSISRVPHSLKIKTPLVNAGVDGTEFIVQVAPENVLVGVIEGLVTVSNEYGRIALAGDQAAITYPGKAPVLRLDIRPADSVQWSLYYPSLDVASLKPAEDLLRVGQVEAAEALLKGQDNADALALRSVIAIATNKKQQAIALAQQAVQVDNASAVAYLSLSYARQANFDLPGAKKAAQEAVSKNPQHAIAWTRLAELHLSLAELDEGMSAARRAAELEPELARTQSILGFAHLLQYQTDKARRTFKRAIELDSADPLARLGNGLATIREGDLQQGRREIEIAASLDTNNSLIRSYLGKAYYEEKRNKLAADQFALAKQMDPKDPTPWLYDALRKQSENNPIGALKDLRKSIENNDNRLVYRSKLLLDADEASRAASLARIYNDIGFGQLALVEAYDAVNRDPTNASAHRFLAESYSSLPRHEIARVSEVLQTLLMQPLNTSAIRPQLQESDLGILEGSGPSSAGLGEYNSLFMRNGSRVNLDTILGGLGTEGVDLAYSGLRDNIFYSVGYFKYRTEGYRLNNDQDRQIANLFLQAALTNKTSLQFEYRDSEQEKGDISIKVDRFGFSESQREFRDSELFRLGLRHAVSTNSSVIVSAIKQRDKASLRDTLTVGPVQFGSDAQNNVDALSIEIQHQYKSDSFDVISGVGSYKSDNEEIFVFDFSPLPCLIAGLAPSCVSESPSDTEHTNAYIYSNYYLNDKVIITGGLSYDNFDNILIDSDEFNPKFGLSVQLNKQSRLRFAAFKTVKRDLVNNQSIEPTQIAGFNQFFDDGDATVATRVGLGLDHEYSSDLKFSVEASGRNLDVPYRAVTAGTVLNADWKERDYRGYLYWLPYDKWALKLGYENIVFKREYNATEPHTEGVVDLKTKRIPVGLSYVPNADFKFGINLTHYDQDGEFFDQPNNQLFNAQDDFWLVGLNFSYYLPHRSGRFDLGVKNLLDKNFQYQDLDPANPEAFPDRFVFARFSWVY